MIHGALNALVKVNAKLGRLDSHCKELQCVIACYLVSTVLLKYITRCFNFSALFFTHNYFQIVQGRIAPAIKIRFPKLFPHNYYKPITVIQSCDRVSLFVAIYRIAQNFDGGKV